MKRVLIPLALASFVTMLVSGQVARGAAAEQTWTGVLTDATCGKSHVKMAQGLFSDKECTAACAEKGAFAVIVGDNVFEIANSSEHFADWKDLGAETVKVTGELKDGKIVASKIEK